MEEARRRRRHSAEFKQQVLAECERSGSSVARVALSHGLNPNLVHKWRHQSHGDRCVERDGSETFVPVMLAPAAAATPDAAPALIQIEVRRGAATVQIRWPASAAAECAAWLRGWLA